MVRNKAVAPDFHELAANIYLVCLSSVFLLYTGANGYTTITAAKWHLFELFSIDPRVAFWGNPGRREGLVTLALYYLVFWLLCRHAHPEAWMLYLFGAAMALCCVVSLLQLTGANPFKLYPEGMNYFDAGKLYSGAFLGTVGNTDLFSSVLCLAIPLFWASVWKLNDRRRFLLLIPLALGLFVLFAMSVAGGMVGVLGALVVSAVQWVKTASEKPVVAICGTAILCWCIQAFFNVSSVVATPFFWVIFAMLCAAETES